MVVLTEPFEDVLARHMTYYVPDRAMPFGVLTHPIQNISDADLESRAEQLAALIEAHLPAR